MAYNGLERGYTVQTPGERHVNSVHRRTAGVARSRGRGRLPLVGIKAITRGKAWVGGLRTVHSGQLRRGTGHSECLPGVHVHRGRSRSEERTSQQRAGRSRWLASAHPDGLGARPVAEFVRTRARAHAPRDPASLYLPATTSHQCRLLETSPPGSIRAREKAEGHCRCRSRTSLPASRARP